MRRGQPGCCGLLILPLDRKTYSMEILAVLAALVQNVLNLSTLSAG
ncbi:hypothetical protein ACWDYH_23585 [Nocardia goodfellowii]|uniref:Uncharacterized protein n=1 Tax=Nocardia goodfellowii TaxID=882446 RepID=A0ABS4QH11_9NOCA|nr:hypothetical protein [Nocardia goodfellowii]